VAYRTEGSPETLNLCPPPDVICLRLSADYYRPDEEEGDDGGYEALWREHLVALQVVLSYVDFSMREDMATFETIVTGHAHEPDDVQRIKAIMNNRIDPSRDRIGSIVGWLFTVNTQPTLGGRANP